MLVIALAAVILTGSYLFLERHLEETWNKGKNISLFLAAIISENLEIVKRALDYNIGMQFSSSISIVKF